MFFQTATAWIVAFFMYHLLNVLVPFCRGLKPVELILGLAILAAFLAALIYLAGRRKKNGLFRRLRRLCPGRRLPAAGKKEI